MRKLIPVLILLAAVAALADEWSAEKVIFAFKAGAGADGLVAQINDPANTVTVVGDQDLARLRAAGIPEAVIQALVARAPRPTPTPVAVTPDDPRLEKVAQAIKNGVSESVLTEQIRNSDNRYALSLNDLIYLKQNGVPEAIVAALQAAVGTPAATGKTTFGTQARGPKDVNVDGLLMVKSTFLRKNRQGTLSFKGDEIVWTDAADTVQSFAVKTSAVERAWLKCRPLPAGNFCYELGFSIFKGEDYSFLDGGEPQGSNANVLKLREAIAVRFPNLVFEEKIKK